MEHNGFQVQIVDLIKRPIPVPRIIVDAPIEAQLALARDREVFSGYLRSTRTSLLPIKTKTARTEIGHFCRTEVYVEADPIELTRFVHVYGSIGNDSPARGTQAARQANHCRYFYKIPFSSLFLLNAVSIR